MENYKHLYYTEELHQAPFFGQMSEGLPAAVTKVLGESDPVGLAVGRYDENLSICAFTRFFAENLGFTVEELLGRCGEGLRALVCQTPKYPFSYGEFSRLEGKFRVYMQGNGGPVLVTCRKARGEATNGEPLWILSARMSSREEALTLIENIRQIAQWSIDYDPQGRVTDFACDKNLLTLLGEPEGSRGLTAEALRQRVHPEDRLRVRERMRAFFHDNSRGLYSDEYRLRLASGGYKWVQVSCQAIRRMDGSVSRMAGLYLNVDAWKHTVLREQRQAAFHQAITCSNLGEYYVDLERNTYECLKDAGTGAEGFGKEGNWDELIRWTAGHLVVPEDREKVLYACNRQVIAQRLKLYTGQQTIDCRVLLGGTLYWHRLIVLAAGELENMAIVLVRDVTDAVSQAKANSDLSRKNQAMEQLIAGMVNQIDRFAIIDFEQDTYEFYTQAEKLNVRPRGSYHELLEQMAGFLKPIGTTRTVEDLLSMDAVRQDIHSPTDVYKVELQMIQGGMIHLLSMIPTQWKGECPIQFILVAADVTRAKKADAEARNAMLLAYEAANQANQAKTQFLTNMSHDLRTPLNAIMGMTALAKANLSDRTRVSDCLDKLEGAGKLLLGMVNELLDMGRAESSGLILRKELFRWQELTTAVMDMYRQEIRSHGHSLTVRLQDLEHEQAIGDRTRIQEILSNLLTNAIKYTPNGGRIQVTLSESKCTVPGMANYSLTVEDNGLGMEESFQRRAFEPFAREDSSRISAIPGTGLGLSIVRNLVDLMNGSVALESKQGQGTKITASFSLELGIQTGRVPGKGTWHKVLMADGDRICCRRVTNELQRMGMTADSAKTGRETLQLLREARRQGEPYEYLILAWEMPDETGLETLGRIRAELGAAAPKIAFEAYDIGQIRVAAREAGVETLLAKPIFRSALQRLLLEQEAPAREKPPESLEGINGRGRTILVAEDNPLNREILVTILEQTGACILTAKNGKEAYTLVRDHPGKLDLVLMDIQMPEMNGYQAAQAIRALDRRDRSGLPIVAVTANAFAEDVARAFQAGMNGHLSKPVDMQALAGVLNQFLT